MAKKRKSLLKKFELEIAQRQRMCKNSGRTIPKGESCFVVWDTQFARFNYSRDVAVQMIQDAQSVLNRLLLELDNNSSDCS